MKITLRLILSTVVLSSLVAFTFTGLQVRQEQARLEDELVRQATLVADSLRESVELILRTGNTADLRPLVDRFAGRPRLAGLAVYATDGQLLAMTESLPKRFRVLPALAWEVMVDGRSRQLFQDDGARRWYLRAVPIRREGRLAGALTLCYDPGYIDAYGRDLWREGFLRLLFQLLLLSLAILLIVRWNLIGPVRKTADWMRRLRLGEPPDTLTPPKGDVFAPLSREMSNMAASLLRARSAAAEEARLRHAGESRWTAERLGEHVRTVLKGRPLVVVSHREPYVHSWHGKQTQCVVPPGGLVTAMEPILRVSRGTWIAHGSGDADRETADRFGRLRVPPDAPLYTLRRVWLDPEEEHGHYYGFSNEGLWPLCHIAFTRPVFRAEDWAQYVRVNEKFAEAVVEELAETESPYLLIQDYHFALLPRLVKARRPDAKITLFWHIPWPNPEAFSICPWARELLHGMLGADLVGFHIQFHCNNFLDTVDRMLESRIDWEQFAVNRADHTTWVKPFPISIAAAAAEPMPETAPPPAKEAALKSLGISVRWLGVGVDRLDYTKGLLERFLAIERFLEKRPEFQGQFTFVELAAPSRTLIVRYQQLGEQLDAEVERINKRFQTRSWKPILLLKGQHSHEAIAPFYRGADVCMVTSLHDGMNLVSKEFIAAREDQRGVLVLSQFTGASRELRDALIVNPYDIDQMAEALHYALTMDPDEQRARMARMRQTVEEQNVYRWAASLLTELARVRPDSSAAVLPLPIQPG